MYNRSKSLLVLIVCVLSIFSVQQMSYAHPDHGDINDAKTTLNNGIRYMNITVGMYGDMRAHMKTLITQWQSNKNAIQRGNQAALTRGAIALVSATAALIGSGGTLTPAVAPAVFLGYLAVQEAVEANSIDTKKLVRAMGDVLSLMDAALTDVNTAYSMGGTLVLPEVNTDGVLTGNTMSVNVDGYVNNYRAYLSAGATHLPGETYESLHNKVQRNAGSVDSHTFLVMKTYKHYPHENVTTQYHDWKTFGLPNDYECYGSCTVMFRSPHEAFDAHRTACGSAMEVHKYLSQNNIFPSPHDILTELRKRSVDQGCGSAYYTCDSGEVAEHEERTCNEWVWEKPTGYLTAFKSYKCGRKFRKCMYHTFDHNPDVWGSSAHSDKEDSDDSDDDDDTASAPDPPTPEPSTPSYHACGVHETWQSGSHGAASCGHASHYVCDGKTHQQVQCTSTNANGDQCTYTYWQCLNDSTPSHNHVYPAPTLVACGRAACTQTVSSTDEHRETCGAGHLYWSCKSSHVHLHKTRTCRRSGCGQSWRLCTSEKPTCLVNSSWKCRAQ